MKKIKRKHRPIIVDRDVYEELRTRHLLSGDEDIILKIPILKTAYQKHELDKILEEIRADNKRLKKED